MTIPFSAVLVLGFMLVLAVGLAYWHYREIRSQGNGVGASIGIMLGQYLAFGVVLFIFMMCAGAFNRVLIPY